MNTRTEANVTPETIAKRAYEIWQREGQPSGRAEAHWCQAEKECKGSQAREAERTRDSARATATSATSSDDRNTRQAARPKAMT